MAGLGHREGAGHLHAQGAGQQGRVVLLGAEVLNGGGEEAPLHAGLDLHAGVAEHELLEARDVAAVVFVAADRLREGAVHGAVLDEQVQLAEDALAVGVLAEFGVAVEFGARHQFARVLTGIGPRAREAARPRASTSIATAKFDGAGGGCDVGRTCGGSILRRCGGGATCCGR